MNRTPILFLNVLVIATCGLVYELLAGTLASYVLGDSVTQFSLIIGIYLSALGAGAWLSRFVERDLARRFVDVELAVAVLGGASAPLLFGFFNASVGLWATWLMRPLIGGSVTRLRAQGCVVLALLAVAFVKADALTSLAEDAMLADDIVYTKTTHY